MEITFEETGRKFMFPSIEISHAATQPRILFGAEIYTQLEFLLRLNISKQAPDVNPPITPYSIPGFSLTLIAEGDITQPFSGVKDCVLVGLAVGFLAVGVKVVNLVYGFEDEALLVQPNIKPTVSITTKKTDFAPSRTI